MLTQISPYTATRLNVLLAYHHLVEHRAPHLAQWILANVKGNGCIEIDAAPLVAQAGGAPKTCSSHLLRHRFIVHPIDLGPPLESAVEENPVQVIEDLNDKIGTPFFESHSPSQALYGFVYPTAVFERRTQEIKQGAGSRFVIHRECPTPFRMTLVA